ncbi:hypothetical protein [Phormidium tenue]|uniref:Uncharacterized protein n=1 Tax=Phormidium tenue FACHB-1050 TaxID=2692857 RepID=A0ABR8C7M1_9CYAN|nr:hypothetical protein [Phormidium tenue]MBD2316659.1 hypothetical protein [Phormidium tenue FACHB-1050]
MTRQSREELWDDDDFQPMRLLGKGSEAYKAPLPPSQATIELNNRLGSEAQKLDSIRRLHRQVLTDEFPHLNPLTHVLDKYDTVEKIREYLTKHSEKIEQLKKPVLKKPTLKKQ